ncbi:Protein NDRG3 [Araneus ventricosus]|uniref:Protein NDRG3 n=2 Tax=Araneus ventricosus TaxID=182803 RepID=A0A4Y2QP25_ARAVE|nr:Protein NDRG3 [Araneus ventricosus]
MMFHNSKQQFERYPIRYLRFVSALTRQASEYPASKALLRRRAALPNLESLENIPTRSYDLIQLFRHNFKKSVNPANLGLFIDSFIRRSDLQIVRETDPSKKRCVRNFRCHVLLMCGAFSPHLEDTVTMNGRLDPSNSTWMKVSDCGMPLEERPNKVREALYLFLQGLGYAVNQYRRRSSAASTTNDAFKVLQAYRKSFDYEANQLPSPTANPTTTYIHRQEVHIVENPINQHTGP